MGNQAGLIKPSDLQAWVGAGNAAVLLCPFQNAHLDELGLRVEEVPKGEVVATAEIGAPLTRQAPSLRMRSSAAFKIADAKVPVEVLYKTLHGPTVLLATLGSGRMILLADSFPATNAGLPEEDNALFLLNAAESALGFGDVIFDETATRLDLGAPGVMAYARKAGLQPVFLEIGILVLIAIWHLGARAAPPVSHRPRPRTAIPDYVTGRARLYEKASMGRTAMRALAETLRDALQRMKAAQGPAAAEGARLLDRARLLERARSPRERDIVDFARSIHDFMNEAIWKPGHRFRRAPRTAPWRRK